MSISGNAANYTYDNGKWVSSSGGTKMANTMLCAIGRIKDLSLTIGNETITVPASISKSNPEKVKEILQTLVPSGNVSTGPTQEALSKAKEDIDKLVASQQTAIKPTRLPKHPHIDSKYASAIHSVLHPLPRPPQGKIEKTNEEAFKNWKNEGIIDDDGNIDFKKLGVSTIKIHKANLKGKIIKKIRRVGIIV